MGVKKTFYVLITVLLAVSVFTFRPGAWLIHKPANTQNAFYVKGWEDGCLSGTNSYSLFYAPLLDKPFVKEADQAPSEGDKTPVSADRANYKSGWNEGFTMCRYYQSSVYELLQFAIVTFLLMFIAYRLSCKKN